MVYQVKRLLVFVLICRSPDTTVLQNIITLQVPRLTLGLE